VGCTTRAVEWRDEGVAGSGLFALEDIDEGDLGTIPLNATISQATLTEIGWTAKLEKANLTEVNDVILLGSYVMYEKLVNNYQVWKLVLKCMVLFSFDVFNDMSSVSYHMI
jgi:hypothetical protein